MNKLEMSHPVDNRRDCIADVGERAVGSLLKKWRLFFVLAIAMLAVIFFLCWRGAADHRKELEQQVERQNQLLSALREQEHETNSHETVPVITSETITQQLGSVKELVTQEYIYTNADKKESSETWLWGVERPFSGKSILITYDGIIKAGVDLSQASIEVDQERHLITVTLPSSTITSNEIPQEGIHVVEVKNGLFNDVTFDNYNDFVAEQKLVMERRAIDQGLLTKADEEAEALVRSVLSVLPGMNAYTLRIEQAK